ncbi:MAG: FAD-dependent oxidoreductase [Chloroflexi bacterium]|nr:FAD-dependent oxidoreductase [Chloroflexota bacterium]
MRRDLPVYVGKLEAFVADVQRERSGFPPPAPALPTGRRAAIVGAGPAGLAAAEELTRRGHSVTVFDAWPQPGGLLVYGIPGFKLDKRIVAQKVAYLESIGVTFVCNTLVGRDIRLDDLLDGEQFDAVFLGTGTSLPVSLDIPGEDLQGVYQSTDFLLTPSPSPPIKSGERGWGEEPRVGKNVIVIGGGDTAMDCVRTARRVQQQVGLADSRVTCVYRRSEAEMPGRAEERVNAREEGVLFEYLTAPVRFIADEAGHMRAVEFIRMQLGEPDASGRRRPVPVPGSNYVAFVDTVVCALGYRADPLVAETTPDLRVNKWGLIVVDPQTGATSRPGVYAGGDNVSGADLVVTALAAGRRAARAMDEYLRGLPVQETYTMPQVRVAANAFVER